MAVIDFHCHLDLYKDPHAVVSRCLELNLYVLSVTTVPSAFEGTAALAPQKSRIRTALGMHPELAAARMRELPLFESLLPRTRYVGEVGLDGSRDHRASLDRQVVVLTTILKLCAAAGSRFVSLHSRGATGNILDLLEAHPTAGTFILHWYLGSGKQIARAVEMGCWFSVGPSMLTSAKGRLVAATIPHDRVLPESDGPFGKLDGQPAWPWQAWSVVPQLAEVWQKPEGEVQTQLLANFKTLMGLESTMAQPVKVP